MAPPMEAPPALSSSPESESESSAMAAAHAAQGGRVDAKGYSVDAKGYSVDAKGYSVDAKGYSVDTKGYSVDAKGCSVAAARSTAERGGSVLKRTRRLHLLPWMLPDAMPPTVALTWPAKLPDGMIHMGRIFLYSYLPADFTPALLGRLCLLANERGLKEGHRAFWGGGAALEWCPHLETHPALLQICRVEVRRWTTGERGAARDCVTV
eukprot:5571576-Pyramimonas_sp.AAC.1